MADHNREPGRPRTKLKFWHKGQFWMVFWLTTFGLLVGWGTLTFLFWMDSVPNLNALSVAALWLACGAGIQSALAMRKADSNDEF